MFGGLSIKGDTKEDASAPAAAAPAPSSGFSFLQSSIGSSAPAPAAPAPSAASAASSDNTSSSGSGMDVAGPSAFGFMSGVSIASSAGQEEAAAAPPPSPPASMFAGLTPSSSAKEPTAAASEPATSAPPGSGFSFLAAPTPAAPQPAAVPETAAPSPGGSGFSFLSAPAPTAAAKSPSNADAASTATTAGSSFSFMASMTSSMAGSEHRNDGGETGGLAAVKEREEGPDGATAGGASGFSFLSAAAAPTAAAVAPAPPPSEAATVEPPPSQPPSLISEGAKLDAIATAAKPAPPKAPAPGDLFSMSNPSLPAGSGVSWSAPPVGAVKKVVKKKRGKRVGVGSAATTGAAELPAPTQFQPPSVSGADPATPQRPTGLADPSLPSNPPMMPNHLTPEGTPGPQASLTPMRIKAERAMDKADEFIREKQENQRKSAIAMAAERAMQERSSSTSSVASGGGGGGTSDGGWKTSIEPPGSPDSTDETYQAAKAAAAEAQKLATDQQSHSKKKGKGSLFGNFFHRKGGGSNSSGHGISSRSSHGGVVASPAPGKAFQRGGSNGSGAGGSSHAPLPPTQEKMEIASYGDPRPAEPEPSPVGMQLSGGAGEEDKSKELEEAQRRLEFQRQQQQRREAELREAAAVEAEIRRRKEERQLQEQKEEEERLRKQEEERLRRRSPRVKMQSMLDHLADATRTSTDEVTLLRARRAELVKERAKAEKAERYAEQQRAFAETQQTLAAEEEDFESADRLAGVIERHAQERKEQENAVRRVNESIMQLDREKEAASKAVAACFHSVHAQLKALEDEVDDRSKEEGVLDQFATTSKRLSSETERLSNDLKHIERDEEVWKEESKELAAQIEEETKEFVEKCSEASTKLEEVNKTIEDLRKQLAEAESKASELAEEISTQNQSVEKVRSKYSRQLGRLEKKEQSVKESRWDWESEKESIEKARAAHEAVVAAHSEDMLSREKLITDIKSESSVAKDFEEIVSSAFAYVRTDGKVATGDLDSEVLKCEAAVNEAQRNVVAAETNVKNLEGELAAIEVRVPILEAEKKVAAGKRDFKSASRASKQIKEMLSRKELCAAELAGEARECEQLAKEELRKISASLEEKKAVAAEKGKEAGFQLMKLLRAKIDELKSTRQKFATPDSEKFGTERWGEDEDDAITVACVGAFVIESQILVLEAEGKSLGEKYGGWDSDDVVEDASVHSAPTFDSADDDENDSNMVIDKAILEKYIEMRNEMKELEGSIEEAAGKEDFDKAAELEERVQAVREEFEAAGFMTEKFDRALKAFTSKPSGDTADVADSAENGDSSSKVIDESAMKKYSSLCADIKELEASIETAVASDDFDTAAELEEKVQLVRSEIESLGFSVDDLEEALKNQTTQKFAGEEDKKVDDERDASSKGASNDSKEKCADQLNVNNVKMNGESAQVDKDAVDNTDEIDDEDGS